MTGVFGFLTFEQRPIHSPKNRQIRKALFCFVLKYQGSWKHGFQFANQFALKFALKHLFHPEKLIEGVDKVISYSSYYSSCKYFEFFKWRVSLSRAKEHTFVKILLSFKRTRDGNVNRGSCLETVVIEIPKRCISSIDSSHRLFRCLI